LIPGGAPTVIALLGEHVTSAITDYPPVSNASSLAPIASSRRSRSKNPGCPIARHRIYAIHPNGQSYVSRCPDDYGGVIRESNMKPSKAINPAYPSMGDACTLTAASPDDR
jgi:hypothetical protein